jgi:preprotein translocase subunit SecD
MQRSVVLLIPFALTACVTPKPTPSTLKNALILGEIMMPSHDIVSAEPGFSPNGQPLVTVRLTPAGAVQLEAITRSFLGREMPIRVGTELLSNPRVMEPIAGGQFQISGLMTVEDAQKLANRIAGR